MIDHGNTLTQQHHQKGIFDLAFPHLTDGNLTGRAFHTAVPGIIIAASVLIAFAIGLVMFIIVAHQVIHGKSVLADHVIDHSMILAVMTDMPCCSLHHTFIAFQETAHILEKIHIALRSATSGRELSSVKMIKIKALEDQFCSGKDSIPKKHLPVKALSQHMKSIYMVKISPELQSSKSHQAVCFLRKIEFHDTGNAVLVQLPDHIPKFLLRFSGAAVSTLRAEIEAGCIAPVIHYIFLSTGLDVFTAFLRFIDRNLTEFIGRHQFNGIDPKFFPVRDHLCQAKKSPLMGNHLSGKLRITTDMKLVQDHIFIFYCRCSFIFPAGNILIKEATADLLFRIVRYSEMLSPVKSVCIRILHDLTVYFIIIFKLLQRSTAQLQCPHTSCMEILWKNDLHRCGSSSFFI